MNEWYLRDCSRKIKAVLQAKGRDGKPITNNPPYGYIKDPEDKNRCDMSKPYEWAGVSVVRMLEKPEYMGDTVNFRTKKLSYKDKTAVKNDSDEIVSLRIPMRRSLTEKHGIWCRSLERPNAG